jgi:adenine-specific DNA-methyltransferase
MSNTNSIEQLKTFLKEMFQFNSNDLDFGIYRIYNLKRKEIENFIDGKDENCLEPIINKTLELVSKIEKQVEQKALYNFLKDSNKESLLNDPLGNFEKIQQLIINFCDNEQEQENLKATLTASTKEFNITDEIKDKIYNHILGYFEMYYSNGDFGYNNRSRNLYKVPYEADYDGNDTMFHWKHKGSLYIKTGASFNAIKFKIIHIGIEFELRLETNETSTDEEVARNNNKESKQKHYKFNRFEEVEGVTRIVFNLSDKSTTKADLYKSLFKEVFNSDEDIDKYLFSEGKAVFNDLTDDYDKVQDGSMKGIGTLRVNRKTLLPKVNKNFEKGTKIDIANERFTDETLETIYNIDQKLNSFYIGNDSDYFIHENLQDFLSQEKERYIKNHILSDLQTILDGKLDNTTLIIAKAFEQVSSGIIEFLSTIEEFQKKLFTMKKKVVESEYCLTIDNIEEKYYPEMLANKDQILEWESLFGVKVKTLADLKGQPTLVLDTRFFKQADGLNPLKDKILGEIENIDINTNGLLINSENYQALKVLEEKYFNQINCIYIDPPYNTGDDGFIYKDSFRHSSWATMFYNRISLAKKLLTQSGWLAISIDEREYHRMVNIIEDCFGVENIRSTITVKMSHLSGMKMSHTTNKPPKIKEYLVIVSKSEKSLLNPVFEKSTWNDALDRYSAVLIVDSEYPSDLSKWKRKPLKSYAISQNINVENDTLFEKFRIENAKLIFRTAVNDSEAFVSTPKDNKFREVLTPTGLKKYSYNSEEVLFANEKLKIIDGVLSPVKIKGDIWEDIGINNLHNEGGIQFPNGKKPVKLIQRVLDMLIANNGICLDFFAGSGTSAHASILNNCSYVNIEVGVYFEEKLKRRVQRSIYTNNWLLDKPKSLNGTKKHIFKYLVLEQYEDVLDAIEQTEGEAPKNLPLKYLYKPELNKINSTLDISKPFSNKIKYGQPTKEGFIDLVDTYNYLQGYEVKTLKAYSVDKKYYKVVETNDNRIVVWRDIVLGEDDSKNVMEIAEKYPEIDSVEVNADFNILATQKDKQLQIGNRIVEVKIIHVDVFNQ